jgi:hypothetical protein
MRVLTREPARVLLAFTAMNIALARNHRIMLSATESWQTAVNYAGGFAVAGCEVIAFAPRFAPVRSCPYVVESRIYSPLASLHSLRAAIEDFAPDLIVCCDERALAHLLQLHAGERGRDSALASLIARSLGAPENYGRVLSRSGGLSEMRNIGVRVPDTLPVEDEAELDDRLETIGFPAVLKADATCGGQGVAIVHTHRAAHAAYRRLAFPPRLRTLARIVRSRDIHFLLEAISPPSRKISVQRFVAGRVAASAFAADKGEVIASFCYDILESEKAGMGAPKIVRRVDCPEMEAATRAAAAFFGLTGAHGLDFIRDEFGAAHLIEINPRATRGGTLPFGFGRDVPHALASMLASRPMGIRKPLDTDVVDFGLPISPSDPITPPSQSAIATATGMQR